MTNYNTYKPSFPRVRCATVSFVCQLYVNGIFDPLIALPWWLSSDTGNAIRIKFMDVLGEQSYYHSSQYHYSYHVLGDISVILHSYRIIVPACKFYFLFRWFKKNAWYTLYSTRGLESGIDYNTFSRYDAKLQPIQVVHSTLRQAMNFGWMIL